MSPSNAADASKGSAKRRILVRAAFGLVIFVLLISQWDLLPSLSIEMVKDTERKPQTTTTKDLGHGSSSNTNRTEEANISATEGHKVAVTQKPLATKNASRKATILSPVYLLLTTNHAFRATTRQSRTTTHQVRKTTEKSRTSAQTPTEKTTTEAYKRATILLWNSQPFPPYPIPKIPLCGGGCRLTKKRDDLNASDAVVFGMKGIKADDLPAKGTRRHDQVYVYWTEESAWTSKHFYGKKLDELENNFFNWTMTYKRDSDVNAMMIPYNAREFVLHTVRRYEKLQNLSVQRLEADSPVSPRPKTKLEAASLKKKAIDLVRSKGKMATWVASNCGYTAGAKIRIDIVQKMRSYGLSVDTFGNCGSTKIPSKLLPYANFISDYRFYLAFENSLHCKEYITEKFWYSGLYAGVVPVIWGPSKSDVEAVAPPDSFIHYEDFKSDKALVNYLLFLTKNQDEYLKYFAWWWKSPGHFPVSGITETERNTGERNAILDFEMNALCHLCSMLRRGLHRKTKKTIYSLNDWWYEGESSLCLSKTEKLDRK